MKEASRKWLALTLLAGVFLLSVSLYVKYYLPRADDKNNTTPPSASADGSPSTDGGDDEGIDLEIFYNNLPRPAGSLGGVSFQNAGGIKSEKLKEVFIMDGKSYLLFDTASDGYDLYAKVPSVAAALIDKNLTLIKTLTLPASTSEYFLAAKPAAEGIAVAVKGTNYLKVYLIDYSLNYISHQTLTKADSARFYQGGDELYLFAADGKNLYFTVFSAELEIIRSGCLAAEGFNNVVEILPADGGYNVILSGSNAYGISYFNKNALSSLSVFYGAELQSLIPTSAGYMFVTKSAAGCKISLTSPSLSVLSEVDFEGADYAFAAPLGNNFLIVTSTGADCRFYLYCRHLDLVSTIAAFDKPYRIKQAVYNGGSLTLLAYADNTLTVYNVTAADAAEEFSCYATDSYARLFNGKLYLSSSAKTGYFKNNYGESDIFVLTV